jgi:hypothetical protein
VQFETALPDAGGYPFCMMYGFSKRVLLIFWVVVIAAAGLLASASLVGWLVLATLAVIPAVVFLKFSGHRSQTMSESIQKALR